jgi:hypothetical protein
MRSGQETFAVVDPAEPFVDHEFIAVGRPPRIVPLLWSSAAGRAQLGPGTSETYSDSDET